MNPIAAQDIRRHTPSTQPKREKQMKAPLSILFTLAIVLVLFLALVVTIQGATAEVESSSTSQAVVVNHVAHQEDHSDSASPVYTPNITFTPVSTIYLPLMQRVVPPCTVAPTLISPTNGSQLNSLIAVLTYLRGTTPVSYTSIYIADNRAFNAPIVYSSFGSGLGPDQLRLFDNLRPGTVYYWRVQDVCESVNSPYSLVFSLTTGSGGVILPAPTLVSPVSGTLGLGQQVTLTWNNVGGVVGYQVFVCDGGCTGYFTSSALQAAHFLAPNTTYTWYVKAYNAYAYGNASEEWRFRTGSFLSMQRAKVDSDPEDTYTPYYVTSRFNIYPSPTDRH